MADIEVAREGRVQIIRFNRADKKNAITRAMYKTMADALVAADGDESIGASLMLGQPDVFTSGNDLADFMAVAMGSEHGGEVGEYLKAIATGTKPLVAAVDGLAVGVGCTTLMHCDLVYASPRAWMQTPFVDLGLVPEAGSSLIAPRLMGHQRAFALLVMGERFSAEQAQQAGLVNVVVASDDLEAHAMGAAERLASKPPEALAISRKLIRGDRDEIVARILEESEHFKGRLKSDEARNAFMAFMQKKAK
ncbi:MAG: crotonase/enoyl-CoA hydratase family protein [Rhizobiaceae bacterium]|nr:crotonase/enoyl-CoA hydratase family protein [Hyphomicrobiales bacterium]NRB31928.1 crotonase/enoyl-CoA hydratase family protein [Rhizobiaceae bacterium]